MSSFVSLNNPDLVQYSRQLAAGVNAALRGELHVAGTITLPIGNTYVDLINPAVNRNKIVLLMPMNAHAARLDWYISDITKGSCRINTTSPALDDAVFNYVILGDGGLYGS